VDINVYGDTLFFSPSQQYKWIHVYVVHDEVADEGTETFTVNLQTATNATIGHSPAYGRIRDSQFHWLLTAHIEIEGYGPMDVLRDFVLDRTGGVAKFSLPYGATGTVYANASAMVVSASGFHLEDCVSVSGSGGGSGVVTENTATATVSGPITGTLHVVYSDGSKCTLGVTGTFSATALE
jgi:hypothetical protein